MLPISSNAAEFLHKAKVKCRGADKDIFLGEAKQVTSVGSLAY